MDHIYDYIDNPEDVSDAEIQEIKDMLNRYVGIIDRKKAISKKITGKADRCLGDSPKKFYWSGKECFSLRELVKEIQDEYEKEPESIRLDKYNRADEAEKIIIIMNFFAKDWALDLARNCGISYSQTIMDYLK